MRPTDIDLVVPGLLDIPVHEFDPGFLSERLEAINYCLTHATRVGVPVVSLDETISDCLGQGHRTLPLAQAFAGSEQDSTDRVMLMEPVYLKPDISNVTVFPIERASETASQVDELVSDLQNMFADELHTDAIGECRYLVRFKKLRAPDYYPHTLSVLGKTINRYVEQAKQDLDWYRLLTEIQMYLHNHPVNQKRQASGAYPINSFWFWGGGERLTDKTRQVVYSDDELIRQFFSLTARSVSTLEETVDFSDPSLVISLRLFANLKSTHADSLETVLLDLEQKIFAPAVESLRGQGKTLRLRVNWQQDFCLRRLHRWRFWRANQSLGDFRESDLQMV